MQRIIVDITPGFRMPTIHFSQGDVGTQFAVNLRSRFGDSLPASPTVTIQATKPSGFGFTESATSFTNGVAVFTTTADMTDEAGRFPVEIKVVKDSVTLFSANFYMDGEATTHPDGTIDGQQEQVIPELTQLVERVETAASSVLDMTVEAETLAAGSQATYSYDEDTNTATFGIPQGEAGAGAAGVVANAYSSSQTYAVGDYVIHNGYLYRCTTAITTAESFTAGHWTQVVLGDDVSDLKSDYGDAIGVLSSDYNITTFEGSTSTETWSNNMPNGTHYDSYVDDDGNEHSSTVWNHYEFPCQYNDKFKIHTYCIAAAKGALFFDSNDKLITAYPQSDYGIVDIECTAPIGAVKLIVNYENDILVPTCTKLTNISINASAQVAQIEQDLYTNVEGDWENWISHGTLKNGYMDSTGNEQSGALWNHYEFAVTAGEKYKTHTYYVPAAPAIVFLNSSNGVVSTLPVGGEGGIADVEAIVPTNAVKMVINYENDVLVPTIYKMATTEMTRFDYNNVLYGKTFGALGDSITYGQGVVDDRSKVWGNLIALRNGMTFANYGISGSTMGDSADSSDTNPCWTDERYKNLQNKDYGIIWFGWNDYYFGKLGTVSQADPTTFLGAYYNTLVWLIENSPKTKIGVIIPYLWTYNTDPQGFTIMALINGLKEVCEICGIPYLDLNNYNFLQSWGSDAPNDDNYYVKWNCKQQVFTSDTLHPNVDGNEYLSTIIEGFMRTL